MKSSLVAHMANSMLLFLLFPLSLPSQDSKVLLDEQFSDNRLQWPVGKIKGADASIEGGRYCISNLFNAKAASLP